MRHFDFGENWGDFSANALKADRIRQAREDLAAFMARGSVDISRKSFLDIGFGQGLSPLSAASMGANAVGCDINQKCAQVLERNRNHFPEVVNAIPEVVDSILDVTTIDALSKLAPDNSGYEIVHSWGVLHYTGNIWQAIENATSLVQPGGMLVLALYNRHWTSPAWTAVKLCYVRAPAWLQKAIVAAFFPAILAAKWARDRAQPDGHGSRHGFLL